MPSALRAAFGPLLKDLVSLACSVFVCLIGFFLFFFLIRALGSDDNLKPELHLPLAQGKECILLHTGL